MGMKLVKGAKIAYSTSGSTEVTGNIGIDTSLLGISVGPKGHWRSTKDDKTGFNRESEFVFAFRVKRLTLGRKLKVEDYNKGAFLAIGKDENGGESVLVEDVDGSDIKTAIVVPDEAGEDSVYCIPS